MLDLPEGTIRFCWKLFWEFLKYQPSRSQDEGSVEADAGSCGVPVGLRHPGAIPS